MFKARKCFVKFVKKIIRIFLCTFSIIKIKEKYTCTSEQLDLWLNSHCPRPDFKIKNNQVFLSSTKYDLSIIVPIYNAEKYLDDCLQSLINQQTKLKYEIILVNDGSTDNSESIIKKYCNKYNFINYIYQDNSGCSAARNTGIYISSGLYLTFVDADDIIDSKFVSFLIEKAKQMDLDIIQCNYRYFLSSPIPDKIKKPLFHFANAKNLYCFPWGHVYKRDLFRDCIFPENYLFEDTINLGILFKKAKRIGKLSNNLYNYRINNAASITGKLLQEKNKYTVLQTLYITDEIFKNKKKDKYNIFAITKQTICNIKRISALEKNEIIFCLEYIRNFIIKEKFFNCNFLFKQIYLKHYSFVLKYCKFS